MKIPAEICTQLELALDVIDCELNGQVLSVHLFGSAVMGGLKHLSDIDLLVTVREPLEDSARQSLMMSLLRVSAYPPTTCANIHLRPLEVTVLAESEIKPWRHPARRQLQFGEWLRKDLQLGQFEPPTFDHDLTILLAKVRHASITVRGPEAATMLPVVPGIDVHDALRKTIAQWVHPEEWAGEERGVVLTLARVWFTAATGEIAAKDSAARWLLERLPAQQVPVLELALESYVGSMPDVLSNHPRELKEWIDFARSSILRSLASSPLIRSREDDDSDKPFN